MRRRIVALVVAFIVAVSALTTNLMLELNGDLGAARRALSREPATVASIRAAEAHLRDAQDRLGGQPATILGVVPVIGPNLAAVRSVVQRIVPVVNAADAVMLVTRDLQERGVVKEGAVRLELLERLREPLQTVAEAIPPLRSQLGRERSGWLVPPLWDAFVEVEAQVNDLAVAVSNAAQLIDITDTLFGARERRKYLVLLLNNAELRGAGGIPSGVGTLSARDGKLSLGRFFYYADLRDRPPYRQVRAPADFRRRYGIYGSDTTRWVNVTFSPDVPDVALVASKLFRVATGDRTHGAIVVDPRGLAALLPPNTRLRVPRSDTSLRAADLPEYVYSRAYEELGGARAARRRALLTLGKLAFRKVLHRRSRGTRTLRAAGGAIAGGHLRFVSFDPRERTTLSEASVSDRLPPSGGDIVLVTVQNFGGDKLDFWIERSIEHRCRLSSDRQALCGTRVVLDNRTPDGLSNFVANVPFNEYGVAKRLVDTYLPGSAEVTRVDLNDEAVRFYDEEQAGYRVIGVYLTVPQAAEAVVEIEYEMPLEGDAYALSVRPQPLTSDAHLTLRLDVPSGWLVYEGGTVTRPPFSYSGPLDREMDVRAAPERRAGISALWEMLGRFWREPIL